MSIYSEAMDLKDELNELKEAFTDVLDGHSDAKCIQLLTGLDFNRCEEISTLFTRIMNE